MVSGLKGPLCTLFNRPCEAELNELAKHHRTIAKRAVARRTPRQGVGSIIIVILTGQARG